MSIVVSNLSKKKKNFRTSKSFIHKQNVHVIFLKSIESTFISVVFVRESVSGLRVCMKNVSIVSTNYVKTKSCLVIYLGDRTRF